MRDVRNAKRAEEEWLAGNGPQRCVVCGRLFCRRRDNVCSISRSEKAKEIDEKRIS
jgi:hypothetical protein